MIEDFFRWQTLSCEYLREFSKKFETALMVYSRAWGKLIHEKNQKQKIRDTVPLNKLHAEWEENAIIIILPVFLSFHMITRP
jgi:hypothetical protein